MGWYYITGFFFRVCVCLSGLLPYGMDRVPVNNRCTCLYICVRTVCLRSGEINQSWASGVCGSAVQSKKLLSGQSAYKNKLFLGQANKSYLSPVKFTCWKWKRHLFLLFLNLKLPQVPSSASGDKGPCAYVCVYVFECVYTCCVDRLFILPALAHNFDLI